MSSISVSSVAAGNTRLRWPRPLGRPNVVPGDVVRSCFVCVQFVFASGLGFWESAAQFQTQVFREDIRRRTAPRRHSDVVAKPEDGEESFVHLASTGSVVVEYVPQTTIVDTSVHMTRQNTGN